MIIKHSNNFATRNYNGNILVQEKEARESNEKKNVHICIDTNVCKFTNI
jgi:hypothetical protein